MGKKKTVHVLSNTHWDREWRFPFEETRFLLVDLVDWLLDLMESTPEYEFYNFDSQTIFLEDYLEYRPENRERLQALIQAGRLIVGPWYTLPEMFSVGGEAVVRNLLIGGRIAEDFGKCSKVGYTPTSYGQVSQIAQIYDSFGIDGIIFYRGIHHSECTNEYILESPDGTRILGICLSRHFCRGAFYIHVVKRTMHQPEWYQKGGFRYGEQDTLAFHLCRADEDHEEEPVLLRSPFGRMCLLKHVAEGVRGAMEDVLEKATTDCLVLMDGMDSTYPNPLLPKILKKANEVNPDWKFIHSSLPKFLEDLKSRIDPKKLTVLKGERRHPSPDTMFSAFLKDSLSARLYIKQRNAQVERTLSRWAEPFSCVASALAGKEYPARPLLRAWKTLLACHAHDSIGGLSPDQIHKDMMGRFDQADLIGKTITKRALGDLITKVDTSDCQPEDVLVSAFNPLSFAVDAVPYVYIDLPREKNIRAFSLYDHKGKKVPHQVISREDSYLIATEPSETPMTFNTTKWKVAFEAKGIPALGFKTFTVRPEPGKRTNYGSLITGTNTMENEFLKVAIQPDGTLTVTDKASEEVYSKLLHFEDAGEWGDPWTRMVPLGDRIYSSLGQPVKVQLLEDGPVCAAFSIEMKWSLPVGIDNASKQRTTEEREIVIVSKVSVKKGIPRVFIDVEVDNTVGNHRLRALFDSGFHPKHSVASGAFDVLTRNVALPDTSTWTEPITGTNPHYGLVAVENGKRGVAVLSHGLTEYEVSDTDSGTIALTLLRAFSYPKMSGLALENRVARVGNEGSQCYGTHRFPLALCFYSGSWDKAGVIEQMQEHQYPPMTVHHSPYKGEGLSRCESFFRLEPSVLSLSAIKQSEDGSMSIVRFFNPLDEPVQGHLWSRTAVKSVALLNLDETIASKETVTRKHHIALTVPAKKIVTLGFTLE